jgi:HlyD family secretion protein
MVKKNSFKTVAVIMVLVGMGVAAVLFSERQSEQQSNLSRTITPQIMTITQKQLISGNLFPIREIEVKSTIPGILEEYYVQVGDNIRRGDRVAKIKTLSEPTQIENAKMNLRIAGITYERDRRNFERDKRLYENDVISLFEFEEVSKIYSISKEQFEYAQNQLHLLEQGYIPASNVSNVVVATADGILTDLPLEEGTPVSERNNFRDGTTVALIARLDSFVFRGRIIENDVLALRRGMTLTVMPTSMPDFQTEAVIRKISPRGQWDQGFMRYDIEAVFILPDSVRIYSGFNATAEFILNEKENVLTIPESSLIFQNDSTFVEILRERRFERIPVETGISDGINIEIVNGIDEENRIRK